jgi:hypothetical protein
MVLFGAWLAQGADPVTNTVRWIAPATSNSMEAARWPYHWKSPFAIATNTPAFEAYGLAIMLAQANDMREKWQLDIAQPLNVSDVFLRYIPRRSAFWASKVI